MAGVFNIEYGGTFMIIGGVGVVTGTTVAVVGIEVPPIAVGGASVSLGGLALMGLGASRVHKGGDQIAQFAQDCQTGGNSYSLGDELKSFANGINPLPWPRFK